MKNSLALAFGACILLPCIVMAASESERSQSQKTWAMALVKTVRVNWHRPDDLSNSFICKIRLNLKPNGVVSKYNFVQSCGSPELDTSVVRAIIKSEPLPLPSIPEAFVSEITFSFRP